MPLSCGIFAGQTRDSRLYQGRANAGKGIKKGKICPSLPYSIKYSKSRYTQGYLLVLMHSTLEQKFSYSFLVLFAHRFCILWKGFYVRNIKLARFFGLYSTFFGS